MCSEMLSHTFNRIKLDRGELHPRFAEELGFIAANERGALLARSAIRGLFALKMPLVKRTGEAS